MMREDFFYYIKVNKFVYKIYVYEQKVKMLKVKPFLFLFFKRLSCGKSICRFLIIVSSSFFYFAPLQRFSGDIFPPTDNFYSDERLFGPTHFFYFPVF